MVFTPLAPIFALENPANIADFNKKNPPPYHSQIEEDIDQ